MESIIQTIENTPLAAAIREGATAFPWLESVHVLALAVVVGSIVAVDLRLMGLASKGASVRSFNAQVLPFTRAAFAVAVITGALLFMSNATEYLGNPYFIAKLVLLSLALVNIGYFHLVVQKGIDAWDRVLPPPTNVRVAGALSLTLWVLVVITGRWIAYAE